jgi:hypothetical protein
MKPTNQQEAGEEVAKLNRVIQIYKGKIQAHLGARCRLRRPSSSVIGGKEVQWKKPWSKSIWPG